MKRNESTYPNRTTMDLTYERVNDRVVHAYLDERKVAAITEAPNGQTGFRVFGEKLGGQVDSVDEAKKAITRHFDA